MHEIKANFVSIDQVRAYNPRRRKIIFARHSHAVMLFMSLLTVQLRASSRRLIFSHPIAVPFMTFFHLRMHLFSLFKHRAQEGIRHLLMLLHLGEQLFLIGDSIHRFGMLSQCGDFLLL